MKIRYILAAIFVGAYSILGNISFTKAAEPVKWPTPPQVVSENAILIDADTGEILYEKAAHEKGFPASVTKIITALLTIENCNLTNEITFSREAATSYKLDDSNIGIRTGEVMTIEQALRGILMESANEACYGMGEHISGSVPAFVELMNHRAKELGALNTNFVNTNGLHDNDHYSTCYDLAMIGRACFDNSVFIDMCSDTSTFVIEPTNKYKDRRFLRNKHALLKGRDYYYKYARGGKTGYTEEAGHTLISFAENNGVRLICVIMRSTEKQRYIDTTSLFEYGFNNFEKTALTSDTLDSLLNDANHTFEPENFFATDKYTLSLAENIYALIPIGADISDITAKCTYSKDAFATITFYYGEHVLGSTGITPNKNLKGSTTNLPVLNKPADTKKQTTKAYTIINPWILIAICTLVSAIIIAIAHYLIMNKTEYGAAKKRNKRRRHKSGKLSL